MIYPLVGFHDLLFLLLFISIESKVQDLGLHAPMMKMMKKEEKKKKRMKMRMEVVVSHRRLGRFDVVTLLLLILRVLNVQTSTSHLIMKFITLKVAFSPALPLFLALNRVVMM